MFTKNDLIDIAVKMEKNGEAVYLDAAKKVKNPRLKSLLRWMADEEAAHQAWFLAQKKEGSGETDLTGMLPGILKEMMGDKTLSLDEVDFTSITTATRMLETFAGFETDTILFYEVLEAFIEDPGAKSQLNAIVREEKGHSNRLKEMIQSISDNEISEEKVSY